MKAKKPIFNKWWFWVIVAVVVICVAANSGDDTSSTTADIKPTQESTTSPTPKVISESTPEATPEPTPDKMPTVGDTVTVRNVDITLNDLTISTGKDFFTPDDGKVFLIADVTLSNNGKKELSISSMLAVKAYVDDYAVNTDLSAIASADKSSLDGSIAPGKKLNGILGYQVPADWKVLEINIQPDVLSNNKATFVIENK